MIYNSLYKDGYHRDLHSFPTRRSSDLWLRLESKLRVIIMDQMVERKDSVRPLLPTMYLKPTEGEFKVGVRSEEHTSELQSRRDLVCRLLLEKKNNIGKSGYYASVAALP